MAPRYPVRIPELRSEAQRDRLASLLAPLSRITQPKLYGVEHLPPHGALLVGNHTIYGLLDLPFMMAELWKREHITVRGLGEHTHYAIPVWRDLLELCGMVRGTRDNVRELMREGQNVLVFPGGSREVNKRRGEKYRLIWKERLGFARLAIESGYPIVPFAAVGAEEMLDIVIDDTNPVYGELVGLVHKLGGITIPSVVHGIGPTLVPKPQRLYFWFGEPIDTARFGGRHEDDDAARALRDDVKEDVEAGIEFLLAEREADPRRRLGARLLGRGPEEVNESP